MRECFFGGGISQFVPKPIEEIDPSRQFHEKYRVNLTKILTFEHGNYLFLLISLR